MVMGNADISVGAKGWWVLIESGGYLHRVG